jgi:hypothetical protein
MPMKKVVMRQNAENGFEANSILKAVQPLVKISDASQPTK